MKDVNLAQDERAYINIMESLVAQEVGRQLQEVPARIRRFLKMEEVVTYALNRLPALYASSEKGWQYQRQLAKRDLGRQIEKSVHQAIMAVQVDPLRLSKPLNFSHSQESEAVLQALRQLFQVPDLDWPMALEKLSQLKKNPLASEQGNAQNAKTWQPGVYGGQLAWTHRRPCPDRGQPTTEANDGDSREPQDRNAFGWDNVLYRL